MRHALALLAVLSLVACSDDKKDSSSSTGAPPIVVMETSLGSIKLELDPRRAPLTVDNFLAYVDEEHYDGTVFHRVIDGFMIQGGGFALEEDGQISEKETRAAIRNEAASSGLKNMRGTIAMARLNPPHTATNQFFINVADNANLDPGGFSPDGYAVFGKVTEGMDVVNKIRVLKTGQKTLNARDSNGTLAARPFSDVPETEVVIRSIRLVE